MKIFLLMLISANVLAIANATQATSHSVEPKNKEINHLQEGSNDNLTTGPTHQCVKILAKPPVLNLPIVMPTYDIHQMAKAKIPHKTTEFVSGTAFGHLLHENFVKLTDYLRHFTLDELTQNSAYYKHAVGLFPDFSQKLDFLYTDVERINSWVGKNGIVQLYTGKLVEDRGSVRQGTRIAITVRLAPENQNLREIPTNIYAYSQLNKLREQGITHYFHTVYGAYYALVPSFAELNFNFGAKVFCSEMEWIEGQSYEQLYTSNNLGIDRVLFEEVIANWALQQVVYGNIRNEKSDRMWDNLVVKGENPVAYHIEDVIYFFASTDSPRKVNWEGLWRDLTPKNLKPFVSINPALTNKLTTEAKFFLQDINAHGLLTAIKKHYSEFQVTEMDMEKYPNAQHFYLPSLQVALEKQMCFSNAVTHAFPKIISYLNTLDLNTFHFNEYKHAINLFPDLTSHIDAFYTDVVWIGGGSKHNVYRVRLLDSRNNLLSGNTIALRLRLTPPSSEKFQRTIPSHIHAYAKLEKLRSITPYIHQIYGAYYALMPSFAQNDFGKYKSNTIFCTEMEWIDGGDYNDIYQTSNLISDRVIFEEVVGLWALNRIARASINDADGDVLRHHLIAVDANPVIYHIDGVCYLFPPGYSPRRIDLDDAFFFDQSDALNPFKIDNFILMNKASSRMKDFLNHINQYGFFSAIKTHLVPFSIEKKQLSQYPNANHFYLPNDDIGLEKNLFEEKINNNQLKFHSCFFHLEQSPNHESDIQGHEALSATTSRKGQ